jgi:hypothetical protein
LLSGNGKVPSAVDAIIQRCLAKSPDHRFQTPDELLTEIQAVRKRLWAKAHSPSTILPKVRSWTDHAFPSPDGSYPSSVREMFELAKALGDHESAVALAGSEFGLLSDEHRDASARARESEYRESQRAALERFLNEDWAAAAAAYRELMGRADAKEKSDLLLAVGYCERLAGAQASGRMSPFKTPGSGTDAEPNDSSIGPRPQG